MPSAPISPFLCAICNARNMWKSLVTMPIVALGFVIRARLFEMFFLRGLRLHLFDDAVFLDAVRFKVVGHALRFRDRFIRPFATGDDANGVRIFRSDSRLRCQDDTAALCSDLICVPALQTPSHSRD